ncbi:MAG: archaeosortase/exosortase family protein [Sulfuricella sp.]
MNWITRLTTPPWRPTALSPLWLLALQLAALWPHWVWMARRAGDGSDDPWGVVALLALAALVWIDRRHLAREIPGVSLAIAGGLSVVAALALAFLPPIVAAALATLAVATLLAGMLPPERPRAALAFLALLTLPLAASLNFYLGYPLRWLCAQGAAALLSLAGWQATPEGAALLWNGQTILVDAPCAGVTMLWVGLFAAALLSYLYRASTRRTAFNLGVALLLVVAANVLRNALLFFKEAGIVSLPGWTHDALGLLAFGLALWPLYLIVAWRRDEQR